MNRILYVFVVGVITCTLVAGLNVEGKTATPDDEKSTLAEENQSNASEEQKTMKISVEANGNATVFELNDSSAARDLYAQLPLSIKVENYSNNEKIFYPPKKLNTADTPQARRCQLGTLAYYAPWGDVVMFYGDFGAAPGLYELGRAISGSAHIRKMSGTIQIEKEKSK